MKGKIFIDTNFFVYLFNNLETVKRKKCQEILKSFGNDQKVAVSTQALNELSSVMLNKFKAEPIIIKSIIDDISEYEIVEININHIKKAIDIKTLYLLSYWDSLMLSAAISSNCSTILTEDMNDGQEIEGVKIQNPFTYKLN